jgi:hypothetical protein
MIRWKEFAALEGTMGAEYAAAQGEPGEVVSAIREHILPQGPDDPLPESPEGTILALADRLDVIVGGFRAGLEVSGSQDPYGLRRAGNGIVRILLEKRIRLDVEAGPVVGALYDRGGSKPVLSGLGLRVRALEEGRALRHLSGRPGVRPGDPLDVSRARRSKMTNNWF